MRKKHEEYANQRIVISFSNKWLAIHIYQPIKEISILDGATNI